MSGFLLGVSLHAWMIAFANVVPGALLQASDGAAKGVVVLLNDPAADAMTTPYRDALRALSYAVLSLPQAPRSARSFDALAEQLNARAGTAGRAPLLVAIGPVAGREAEGLWQAGARVHALVTLDACPREVAASPMTMTSAAPWYALQHRDGECAAPSLEAGLATLPNTHLTWLSTRRESDTGPAPEFGALLQWLDPAIEGQGQASARLRGIPLIEMPVADARRAVIFFSGDGGWAALDRGVAAALNAQGVAVLGWDTLSYFWQARPPAVLARDLARVIDAFHARWHVNRVVVAGYSFGASTAPFAVNGLPAATRALIEKVVLLGPTPTTSFEFRLTQWLGSDAGDTAAVAPEVAKLAPLPVWCVHGARDDEAVCPPLAPPSRVLSLPGDHHFNDDYAALARVIAEAPSAH